MPNYTEKIVERMYSRLNELYPNDEVAKESLSQELKIIENADEELERICINRAKVIYGDSQSDAISKRLRVELEASKVNGNSGLYLIAYTLVKKSNDAGYHVCSLGAIGSSLIAYLMDITEIDPLAYNLPFEAFGGFDGDKEPVIILGFSEKYLSDNSGYIEKITVAPGLLKPLVFDYGLKIVKGDFFTTLKQKDYLTLLKELEELSGVKSQLISLEDEKTLRLFTEGRLGGIPVFELEFFDNIVVLTKPKSFDDLVKILGLGTGEDTWDNNAEALINSGKVRLSDVIANRDEIMTYLISCGIDRRVAYEVMERVRRGLGLLGEQKELMLEAGVPQWYIDSCDKILYLIPKANSISTALVLFRIAFYKAHYPDIFKSVFEQV